MISSLDGAVAIDGLSGGLGGPADLAMFGALRASADAVIVGASTANAEAYDLPRVGPRWTERRQELGLHPQPLLIIVSGRLSVSLEVPALSVPVGNGGPLPVIVGSDTAHEDHKTALQNRCELILHPDKVDLHRLLAELKGRGVNTVVLEGGPGLNASFLAEDLIDEWNLTISPTLVGGEAPRAAVGPPADSPGRRLVLTDLWRGDDLLFGRWSRPLDTIKGAPG